MLSFAEYGNAANIYSTENVNKIIVFLSADTMADCQIYKSLSQKYPDLDSKFADAVGKKVYKVGDFLKVQVDTGHIIYFLIIRTIDKFQPYIFNITKALDKTFSNMEKESPDGTALFLLPSSDELKLSDCIFIPVICNKLFESKINIIALSNGDHENYIESIDDNCIHYKKDSWKSDWMLSLDDILLITILKNVIINCHDFKINKQNLVKCYYHCHQNGMFPKIEWYNTDYGPFFKMFLPKSNSLINHGFILNTFHYSNAEPKRFSCSIGPNTDLLYFVAYSVIAKNRERINKIVNDIKVDHIKSYQQRNELSEKTDQPNRQNNIRF